MGIPSKLSLAGLSKFRVNNCYISSEHLVGIEHQYKNAEGKSVESPEGGCFVRIDDPNRIDSDGLRLKEADAAAESFVEEEEPSWNQSKWLPRIYPNGMQTWSGKGAWLECRDIQISVNKSLYFRYDFLRFSSLPTNAFAALLFFPQGDTNAPPIQIHWICCIKDLQQDKGDIYQTGWTEDSVKIDGNGDFCGTVRWIVSTGHFLPKHEIPNNTRFVRPGCLLIDAIDIH
jgi:hypothetical protein